jgi:hypothetical protein
VFGSSKLPPWVERGGYVDSIGKLLIISFFVLKTMLSIIYIRDITTLPCNAQMLLTLLDSTPKDKENLAINGFVYAAPWAKGYLLSKRRLLNRSG